jgi:hypothetical protein
MISGRYVRLRQLNLVYDALIAHVHNYRGSVIGFAGDAMTCWFQEKPTAYRLLPSASRAVACALAMQNAMCAFPHLAIKSGDSFVFCRRCAKSLDKPPGDSSRSNKYGRIMIRPDTPASAG